MVTDTIDFDAYLAREELSGTELRHAFESWRQFKYCRDFDWRPKTDTRVGTAVHSLVECLPLDQFEALFCTIPDYAKRPGNQTATGGASTSPKTTWVAEQTIEFIREHPGREFLNHKQGARCRRMIRAICRNPEAMELISDSMREVTITTELNGVACRGRVDVLGPSGEYFIDTKTSRDISPHGFGRIAAELDYVWKMAWYMRLLLNLGMAPRAVKFLVVLDAVPLKDGSFNQVADAVIRNVPMVALENEFDEVDRLLREYEQCMERDEQGDPNAWPGMKNDELHVPNWAMREQELIV